MVAAGGGAAEVAELSWGATDVRQMGAWATPDMVIAADVIYDRQLFDPLLQTFQGYGASPGCAKVDSGRVAKDESGGPRGNSFCRCTCGDASGIWVCQSHDRKVIHR